MGWKKSIGGVITAAVVLAGSAALAQPPRAEMGQGVGHTDVVTLMLRAANLTAEQEMRVRSVLASHRATARTVVEQIRQAQHELEDKFLAGPVQIGDLESQLQRISQLRDQLVECSPFRLLTLGT